MFRAGRFLWVSKHKDAKTTLKYCFKGNFRLARIVNHQNNIIMTAKEIGDLVTERRKLFGLTQDDLAEMADVSPNTVRKVERGKANPTVETLLSLGSILGFQLELKIPHTI